MPKIKQQKNFVWFCVDFGGRRGTHNRWCWMFVFLGDNTQCFENKKGGGIRRGRRKGERDRRKRKGRKNTYFWRKAEKFYRPKISAIFGHIWIENRFFSFFFSIFCRLFLLNMLIRSQEENFGLFFFVVFFFCGLSFNHPPTTTPLFFSLFTPPPPTRPLSLPSHLIIIIIIIINLIIIIS